MTDSTGRQVLLGITKCGNSYVRAMLIHGVRAGGCTAGAGDHRADKGHLPGRGEPQGVTQDADASR
ncbi:hypothetical protein FPE53_25270 [Salmonella enterica subsp. enterica]|uniref:Uncharacterized protein n=2 Tax=Salmonella enterica TaxID=28901 RepID=A0A744QJ40_SALER|nr:hypothetical protein [Salmonella enterica subsp. enterica serovar Aqua]ECH1172489.1 hypothetical protein [Salmonella enterica subsp. enterica serovar Aqua]EDW1732857.1 hypothetical protein [Salmonella enterica subsp. enterica]HAF2609412.1 hypothetical protein [Salmonella enterica]